MEVVTIGEKKVKGFVLNLEEDVAGVVLLGSGVQVAEGEEVFRTKELLSLPVGEEFSGRVINPIGEIIDDFGKNVIPKNKRNIEVLAPGVMQREPVNQPLQTGIKAIDGMIPVGKGQRELIIGTLGTTAIYILMNAVYLYAVPLGQLVGEVKIAQLAAANLFGPNTTRLIQALVATSVLGCLSATLLTNPRTTFALGRDGLFFRFTGNVHPKFQTPTGAIWFQGLWACVLIMLGDFEKILQLLSVPLVIIATMTVIAIFIFRKKYPDTHRPYKCWGYPVVPIIYIAISLAMLVVKFNQRSQQYLSFESFRIGIPMSYLGLGIFILGVPIYYLWRRFYLKAS
jgi:amino acid transporter